MTNGVATVALIKQRRGEKMHPDDIDDNGGTHKKRKRTAKKRPLPKNNSQKHYIMSGQ